MTAPLLVVVTGVPGAGKTTLGASAAKLLGAPLLSLDAIKEDLYDDTGENRDPHRLRLAAEAQLGAALAGPEDLLVVDIWIAPERDTGRVERLLRQQRRAIVELLCRVPADVAVGRYARRQRARPHLPADEPTLQRIRDAVGHVQPLGIGPCIEVDTSREVDTDVLLARALGTLKLQT